MDFVASYDITTYYAIQMVVDELLVERTENYLCKEKEMRPFRLYRAHDSSGVSGTGYVAEGLVTTYGKVFLQWYGPNAGVGFFDTTEDMLAIHGHQGDTYMEFLTAEIVTPAQIRRY